MSERPRFLITTPAEQTWKFDRPVVFLGEWCRLYDRKCIWQNMDAITAAPYGLGQVQKDADHAQARALEERLLPAMSNALNKYHGTQHDLRFWRIVLGHWLRRYVDVILNRVKTLELCLRSYKLSGTVAFRDARYSLATIDSATAIWACNDDRWNTAVYIRILDLLDATCCPVEFINGDGSEAFSQLPTTTSDPLTRGALKWGYRQVVRLSSLMAAEDDAFIISSYLPKNEVIKLQLALRQVPQLWQGLKPELTNRPDCLLRRKLSTQIAQKSDDALSNILHTMAFELLPVCYLEGFSQLTETVHALPWPKRPKFILTGNSFDTDEVFKLWTASKIEAGFRYITTQHGNNYGTHRYMHPSIEETTADRFLTWGWTDGLQQHTPAFIFKTAGRKPEIYDPTGDLLLVELCLSHRITTWDSTYEFGDYFQDQLSFVSELASTPKQRLIIRLQADYQRHKWNEKARWKVFDPSIATDTGEIAIANLIARSRLIVHSYDSTGILETLSQNIPTLAFWQNDFSHLRESAKFYYQLLVDAGIVHFTPESAARKVNEVWGDVGGWWAQSMVQEAREQFCSRYARASRDPVPELKAILNNIS